MEKELVEAIRSLQRALRNRYQNFEANEYYPAVNIQIEKVELLDQNAGIAAESEDGVVAELLG